MSITEELRKTIDELSEEQQHELLETARELLREPSETDKDGFRDNIELNDELISRYNHLRQHPEQVVNARQSNQELREKHGW